MPLSEIRCIGFPFCDQRVELLYMACRKCWIHISPRTRNLLKALVYRGAKKETKDRIVETVRGELLPKLEANLDRKVRVSCYTVVPYTGVHKRKPISKKSSYARYLRHLNQKYYGGPWEGQK
jgi:hypothetical protein